MNKIPLDKKLFEYIALLEKTNETLVDTLKQCIKLLEQFENMVPQSDAWEKMIEVFHNIIFIAERNPKERTLH